MLLNPTAAFAPRYAVPSSPAAVSASAEDFAAAPLASAAPTAKTPAPGRPIDLKREIETIELEQIYVALDLADGIISEAARLLTLKRTTLIEKMRKYGVHQRSEEHTSELQSLMRNSYAVFCLKKKKRKQTAT